MNNGELVSVIMPSYNTGRYIKESIESVINQTYTDWELIIVDDCSTDNTDEVVAEFSDERIKYLKNDKNSGAAISRNYAMREAKGKWIAFLDSDDIWVPEKLEKQLKFMNDNGIFFSYTNYEKIDESSAPLGIYVSGPDKITRKKIYRYDYVGHLTMMYSAEHFGLIQIKDIKKNNDYAIELKLFGKPDAVCRLLNENLAKYRIRKKSISHDKLSKKLRSHYDLFRICDERSPLVSFIFACRNMWYGFLKKKKYEKRNQKGL